MFRLVHLDSVAVLSEGQTCSEVSFRDLTLFPAKRLDHFGIAAMIMCRRK